MTRLSVAFGAVLCLAAPGLARADMSCAEFNGMDKDSQMQIVGAMAEAGEGGMDASGAMVSGEGEDAEAVASDDLVMAIQAACRAAPGRALGDAVGDATVGE